MPTSPQSAKAPTTATTSTDSSSTNSAEKKRPAEPSSSAPPAKFSRDRFAKQERIPLRVGNEELATSRKTLTSHPLPCVLTDWFTKGGDKELKPGEDGFYTIPIPDLPDSSPDSMPKRVERFCSFILNYLRDMECDVPPDDLERKGCIEEAKCYGLVQLVDILTEPDRKRKEEAKQMVDLVSTSKDFDGKQTASPSEPLARMLSAEPEAFTVGIRFNLKRKPTKNQKFMMLMESGVTAETGFFIAATADVKILVDLGGAGQLESKMAHQSKTDLAVLVTFEPKVVRLYVNGFIQGEKKMTSLLQPDPKILIGVSAVHKKAAFQGKILHAGIAGQAYDEEKRAAYFKPPENAEGDDDDE